MTQEYSQALTEVNMIISYMDNEHVKKLPKKFMDFLFLNMDIDYIPTIDRNIPIHKQELKKETKVLLSLLYRNYWCDSQKKQELLQEDLRAKKIHEEKLKEKYNSDNVFKNKVNVAKIEATPKEENKTEIIEYKKPKWYKTLFVKILKLFKTKE